MKIEIKLHHNSTDIIDLCDYGHDANIKWDDLTESEKNEITDVMREEAIVAIEIKELIF